MKVSDEVVILVSNFSAGSLELLLVNTPAVFTGKGS
jgi:hypothetical protein